MAWTSLKPAISSPFQPNHKRHKPQTPQTTTLDVNPETAPNNPGKVATPTNGDRMVNATQIANA
ncbi:hypothetical protein HT663_09710, partial [Ursidibacter maritimus]|uniref:hypothetical protein n=1 Tax=Ursidibacter maritimus TaxID=1331689 RepID=UPI001C48D520